MRVVNVGGMLVLVIERLVHVRVRVLAVRRRSVCVIVMAVVVAMHVLVLDRFMSVPVAMPLRDVQVCTEPEQAHGRPPASPHVDR